MRRTVKPQDEIVITGAAGFIGSGVVRYLNDLGFHRLILVDDFGASNKWKNLLGKRFLDLLPIQGLFPWLEKKGERVAAFIHLGACSDTLEQDVDYLMENNYRYTVRLAEYALEHEQRFIYASSAATYGDGALGFSDDHQMLPQFKPLNPYGYSKHLFDLWALERGVLDRLVGLKYFNVYGPNEAHKGRMASMVYKMVPQVQKEGVIRLYKSTEPDRFSDGGQCRDFIYVKDAVAMTCSFLDHHIGGIFNIGAGIPATWNDLATGLFAALELPTQIEYIDMPPELARQYQNYTCADMSKFNNLSFGFIHQEIQEDSERIFAVGVEGNSGRSPLPRRNDKKMPEDLESLVNKPKTQVNIELGYGSEKKPLKYSLEGAVFDYVRNHLLKDVTW